MCWLLQRRHADPADTGPGDALLLAFNLGIADAVLPGCRCRQWPGLPLFSHAGAAIDGQTLVLPAGGALYAGLP